MDYQGFFRHQLDELRHEGRYRVFADLERRPGISRAQFTMRRWRAKSRCGVERLSGMGQHPAVMAAMHDAIDRCGAGAGGTRNISGTDHYHVLLERELADLHGTEAALLFNSGYMSNWATLARCLATAGLRRAVRRIEPRSMIEGIRHSRAAKHIFAHNDPADLDRKLAALDPARAQTGRVRIGLLDGWRHRADRRTMRRRRGAWGDDLSRRGACGRALRAARRRHCRARGVGHRLTYRGHPRQSLWRDRRLLRRRRLRFRAQLRSVSSLRRRCRRRWRRALSRIRHLKNSSTERAPLARARYAVRRRLDAAGIPHREIRVTSCR